MAEEKVIDIVCEEDKKSTWERIKTIGKKAVEKSISTAEWAVENPGKALAAITAATVGVSTLTSAVNTITAPFKARDDSKRYYDRFSTCRYIETRRKLSSREEWELDEYVRHGGSAYEWLRQKRLVR